VGVTGVSDARGVQKRGSSSERGVSVGIDSFALPQLWRLCVVWSFVYVALCRLLQLVVLLCRSERSTELEILLLRHELAILRRRSRRGVVHPSIGRFSRRSPGRSRGALGRACRCVPRRCCAGTASWSGGPGPTRTDGRRGGHRSIVGTRRSSFGSHARTRLGATGGSSASCEALASRLRPPRCGRSSSATGCRRRRSETSSPGETSCAGRRRRRSHVISSPSRPPG